METLKDLRLQSNLTRYQVAKKLNVSYTAISNYEQGTRKINIEQVLILSKLFDVSEKEVIKAQLNSCQNDR